MKLFKQGGAVFITLLCAIILHSSYINPPDSANNKIKFPYKAAGLSERAAAAHLLSRFTFGATPGEIDAVVQKGLEKWFAEQLQASSADDSLYNLLQPYDALSLTNAEIVNIYPRNAQTLRMAMRDGIINRDSAANKTDKKAYRDVLRQYMKEKGIKSPQDLYRQFISQKILRAAYSKNQLKEVMTSFWFNHFNVALAKNDCAQFIPVYERDVIRPGALGSFESLLINTAKSPAMLYYLDNFSSSTSPDTTNNIKAEKVKKFRKFQGINENYARELMELHTLGVDGGYTQSDVTDAAKILTGWTVYPIGNSSQSDKLRQIISTDSIRNSGWIHEGDFMFNPRRHDMTQKIVMGHTFPAGRGYEEGLEFLSLLAHNPSTARFICREIAVRFVCDSPSLSLVEKMSNTFIQKNGDIKSVLTTMVSSPEFWAPSAIREKIKSPFELAINSVRSLRVQIDDPIPLSKWIDKMGEKMYNYQAPTGFPDKGQYWINAGSLLNRMNFGLAFSSGQIRGLSFDLLSLNNYREPGSTQEALTIYGRILIPLADSVQLMKRLGPLLNDPAFAQKISTASTSSEIPIRSSFANKNRSAEEDDNQPGMSSVFARGRTNQNNNMLSQVVGILIGSPDFQRR